MKDIGDLDDSKVDPDQDSSSFELKSPRKTVHFADTKGLSLSSTHFFPAEEEFKSLKYRAVKESNEAQFNHEAALESEHGQCATKFLNFKSFQSNESLQKIMEKRNVCLQQIMLCDSGINGRILVRNLAFEKEVFIRYTVDSWLSYEEECACYIPGSSTGFTDAFAFCIRLNQELGRKKMEFAVWYRVGGNEFWDNNHGILIILNIHGVLTDSACYVTALRGSQLSISNQFLSAQSEELDLDRMLLVTSPLSITCGHYSRSRNDRFDFGSACWSFPATEQPQTASRVETKRKKTVHFADTKGLTLTSTFFFVRDNHHPLPENRRKIFANFYQSNVDGNANRMARGQQAKLLNFKSPLPNASQKECLDRNNVCLEKTLCNMSGIYGRVKVKNIAFKKEVYIRYSWDSWKTFEDTPANYMPGSSTGETDTFFFHIKPPLKTSEDRKVEFAICYKVNEGFHWDNNFGDNYRLIT